MDKTYIEKSREAIKSIPNIKVRLKELNGLIKNSGIDKDTRKTLKRELIESMIMLTNYVNSLKSLSPEVGVVLIEHYANGVSFSDIAYKHGLDYQKVSRIAKMKDASLEEELLRLSVRLYGMDAIGFIFEDPEENLLYEMLLGIDGEDLEEDEALCE